MNQADQNRAIAIALGWAFLSGGEKPYGKTPDLLGCLPIPDYCNDLNAMHEAEKVLTDDEAYAYSRALQEITRSVIIGSAVISATAAQRAEAFLKTLNLWTK